MSAQELTCKSILNDLQLPTLMEMSFVTISRQILETEEARSIICKHFSVKWKDRNREEDDLSHNLFCELTSLCKSLQLPDILRAKLVSCFYSISEQYSNWIEYVERYLGILQYEFRDETVHITYIMNSTKWSMGVIDRYNSLHQLFSSWLPKKNYIHGDNNWIFKVASAYCLENDLKIFWEKMSSYYKRVLVFYCHDFDDCCTFYWVCKMKGDMTEFMEKVSDYFKKSEFFEVEVDYKDPDIYAFVLHIFERNISGMKYFKKLANVNSEQMAHITRAYLKNCLKEQQRLNLNLEMVAEKLLFLLKEIGDEVILKDIFNEFYKFFLKISVIYWPWHKVFFPLLKIFVGNIDQDLFMDLILQLLKDVKTEKSDIFLVHVLWKEVSNEVKKLFCLFICNKQEDNADVKVSKMSDCQSTWKNMPIEFLDLVLKNEELRDILTPYENYGIIACICAGRYDLIEFWLQKFFGSDKEIKIKIEEIKKAIINHCASEIVLKCLRSELDTGINNILQFLFKGKMEDEEWLKMLFEFKKKAIEIFNNDDLLKEKFYYYDMILLINWGKENEDIKKGNQDLKNCFIECFKNNMEGDVITAMILDCKFVCFFLQEKIARNLFDKVLKCLKEMERLVEQIISIEDSDTRDEFYDEFYDDGLFNELLTYHEEFSKIVNSIGFDQACVEELNLKILIRFFNGIWAEKIIYIFFSFFDWCVSESSDCDRISKNLKLKKGVLDMLISKYSKYSWDQKNFLRLDELFSSHSTGDENDLKRVSVEKYGVKNCSQCLINGDFYGIKAFIEWAEIEDEELINDFKRNILIEILNVENVDCWKDKDHLRYNELNCRDALQKFLYDYDEPDPVEIATMKLDLLEVHFFIIFEKLFGEYDQDNLKGFLKWSFDSHMMSSECLFRTEKLIKEMAEKFGKEFCNSVLMECNLNEAQRILGYVT